MPVNNNKHPSLCIVSPSAYGAMTGGRAGVIGGVEWQTSLTARWFAVRGYPTSILTWHEGGPEDEMIDKVRVIKICRRYAGLRGLRFFHPKWTGLNHALQRAEADLYYQNGGEGTTGQTALWCRRHRKPFVFSIASDADCNPRLPELAPHERLLYRYGVRRADCRIAQTVTQSNRLREIFGLDSVVIPMPCPDSVETFAPPSPHSRRVLWIGRVCQVKRPDRLGDLAAACAELTFDLVGPIQEQALWDMMQARAKGLPNLKLCGVVPRDQMPGLYRQSAVLCCTSEYEGFPNTFLEAWSHGLPVVSTFDPDGIIAKRNLGMAVKDTAAMAAALRSLLNSPARYQELSQNARAYFDANHKSEAVMPRFEQLFLETMAQSRGII